MNQISEQKPSAMQDFRAGYIAVVGLPNVGKSTLLNQLLQYKLSIVSHKPQTTRQKVLGILNDEYYQMIFMDTPGLLRPEYRLQKAMMGYIKSAINDADILVYTIDASLPRQRDHELREQLRTISKPIILVLNKIDLLNKKKLLPLMAEYIELNLFKALIPISAKQADGLERLKQEIFNYLPLHPPYYPNDCISDQQERFFVSETIREKIFHYYHQELPYASHIDIEEFKEVKQGKDYIRAVIFLERASQKPILIGKQGKALKRIAQLARMDIEKLLGRPVFLELYVKILENWRYKDPQLKKLGY